MIITQNKIYNTQCGDSSIWSGCCWTFIRIATTLIAESVVGVHCDKLTNIAARDAIHDAVCFLAACNIGASAVF